MGRCNGGGGRRHGGGGWQNGQATGNKAGKAGHGRSGNHDGSRTKREAQRLDQHGRPLNFGPYRNGYKVAEKTPGCSGGGGSGGGVQQVGLDHAQARQLGALVGVAVDGVAAASAPAAAEAVDPLAALRLSELPGDDAEESNGYVSDTELTADAADDTRTDADGSGLQGKDKGWDEFTEAELAAAELLGYDPARWDAGEVTKPWRQLDYYERDAALLLGYRPAEWDAELLDADGYDANQVGGELHVPPRAAVEPARPAPKSAPKRSTIGSLDSRSDSNNSACGGGGGCASSGSGLCANSAESPQQRRLPGSAPTAAEASSSFPFRMAPPPAAPASRESTARERAALTSESLRLLAEHQALRQSKGHSALRASRERLPIAAQRQQLLAAVAQHPVVIVCGQTGCGKSTQLPQFLLEEAIDEGDGASCTILCLQPRRVAALALAQRVAEERGEAVGETVGYKIRLESKHSVRTRILFCTTGVALRRLAEDPTLRGVSHVVVDEAHERSEDGDFVLMVLRRLLDTRTDLKLLLMSATLDADLFCSYFGGAPSLVVPGRTFPVTPLYLEDALQLTRHLVRPNAEWARRVQRDGRCRPNGDATAASLQDRDDEQLTPRELKTRYSEYSDLTIEALERLNHSAIDVELIVQLVEWIVSIGGDGVAAIDRLVPATPAVRGAGASSSACAAGKELAALHPAPSAPSALASVGSASESQPQHRAVALPPGLFPKEASPDTQASHAAAAHPQCASEADTARGASPAQPACGCNGDSARGSARGRCREQPRGGTGSENSSLDGKDGIKDGTGEESRTPGGSSKTVEKSASGKSKGQRCASDDASAVLVFLPGIREITALHEALSKGAVAQSLVLVPLHSTLSAEAQMRVFARPPPGMTKVVLATNIAETSITVDDVSFVVDCARFKENRYDTTRRIELLVEDFAPQAALLQRRGRAGRVRAGIAFHLVTSHRFSMLPTQPTPELLRVPLERLVLRAKRLYPDEPVHRLLSQLPQPPATAAVRAALHVLVNLGALEPISPDDAALTALGFHLSSLPLDVRIGKLLLLGATLRCVDASLTLAAALSCRSPFVTPFGMRAEADEAKRLLSVGGSDHLTMLHAYAQWSAISRRAEAEAFCQQHFLSSKGLALIAATKRELLNHLVSAGFVRSARDLRGAEQRSTSFGGGGDGEDLRLALGGMVGMHSHDSELIKALLVGAMWPRVAKVEQKATGRGSGPGRGRGGPTGRAGGGGGGGKGASDADEEAKFKVKDDAGVSSATVHPACVLKISRAPLKAQHLVYSEAQQTSALFLREVTPVSPMALLLFGGRLVYNEKGGMINIDDGWIRFKVSHADARLLLALRRQLETIFARKIEQPETDLGAAGAALIDGVIALLGSTQTRSSGVCR